MKPQTLTVLFCLSTLALTGIAQEKSKAKQARTLASKSDEDADKPKARPASPPPEELSSHTETPKTKHTTEPDADADKPKVRIAAVSSIMSAELQGFEDYSPEMQILIEDALALTRLGLTYTFGGSSPSEGGMDCSGSIYYLLNKQGVKGVPRQSDEICEWVRGRTGLHLTPDGVATSSEAFNVMRPGDLLFWTGTYETMPRKLPVSHIMLYLGKLRSNGKPVVFGASDGRYYAGQRRCGVSVFDFETPRSGSKAAFYGYGGIPGLPKHKVTEQVRRAITPPALPKPPPVEVAAVDVKEPLPLTPAKPVSEDVPPPEKPSSKPAAKDDAEPPVKRKVVVSDADKPSVPKKKTTASTASTPRQKPSRPPPDLADRVKKVGKQIGDLFRR